MLMRRGAAGMAAPYPGDPNVKTPIPDGAVVNGVTWNADGTLTTPDGRPHPLDKPFAGPVEDAYLSVMPGRYAHLHHPDGSTTFLRHAGGQWFIGHVDASPLPTIAPEKKSDETPRPKQLTGIYSWAGHAFVDPDLRFQGHQSGVAEFMGAVLPIGPLDLTVNGWRVQRKQGSGVLSLSTEGGRHLFRFCPRRGWFRIKTAVGHVESVNSKDELFFFTWWHVAILALFCLITGGLAIFDALPRVWCIFTHPGRPLPASFFIDDAATYLDADDLFKITEVARDPLGQEEPE